MVKYRLAQEDDYEKINTFHNRIYHSDRTIEQFYWEFHNCPFGKSIYVIAEVGDKIVGTNCVIPIDLITFDKRIIKSGKSEDTLVDPDYRGQKIFYNIYDFLFEKCKEKGIDVIWGFTSAKNPFKKLGFLIPYDHQQSLIVNSIWNSYKYLSALNSQNKVTNKLKILGLCILAKLKTVGRLKKELKDYRITIDEKIIDKGVTDIISSNLSSLDQSFAILQNPSFQSWRIYENPNFFKVHTYGFYNNSDKLIALVVLNSHPNKVAYISQCTFRKGLSKDESVKIIRFVTRKIFDLKISLIRNWHFDTNSVNKEELKLFTISGYIHLTRGIGLVWKELNDVNIKPGGFYLSRIATQGKI